MNRIKWIFAEQAGMTAIEIIIVLVIIGVLAATVFVQFVHTSESAQRAACHANQAALKTSLNIYYAQHRDYPEEIGMLAPYLTEERLPVCPSGGTYLLIHESDIACSLEEHQ